jgi:hypothetical protein
VFKLLLGIVVFDVGYNVSESYVYIREQDIGGIIGDADK